MRIAYLECFSGISGDMFLGALVDAGVSPRLLEETVAALGIGAHLKISKVVRSGISATKVDVCVAGEPAEVSPVPANSNPAHNDSAHGHHHHESPAAPAPHSHGRGLVEILEIIRESAIPAPAKETA